MDLSGQTILIVDDDIISHKIISNYLEELNSNLLFAANGIEALSIYKKQKVDIIITDLSMPKMNGVELIKEIRNKDFLIPIIVLTSHLTSDNFIACANLNIHGLVDKPLDKYKLLDSINNLKKYDQSNDCNEDNLTKLDDELFYDSINSHIIFNNENIKLTKKERLLLELLIKNKNSVVSYKNIEVVIWYYEDKVMTTDALKNVIKSLRKKLSKDLIKNISGLGYKIII